MTDIQTIPNPVQVPKDEDPKVSHFVSKEDWMRGYLNGEPIKALCGYIWVPTRDPQPLPRCKRCEEILNQIHNARRGMN